MAPPDGDGPGDEARPGPPLEALDGLTVSLKRFLDPFPGEDGSDRDERDPRDPRDHEEDREERDPRDRREDPGSGAED